MGPSLGRRIEEQPASDRRSLVGPSPILPHDSFLRPRLDEHKKSKFTRSSFMQRRCILLGILVLLLVRA